MVYTIENRYLNRSLVMLGVFMGIIIGVQYLGDGLWLFKTGRVVVMFITMCAVFYLLRELNAVKLTQTGIQLAFSKEIAYQDIISYEEKSRITSSQGRTVSRPVLAVTTKTSVVNIPFHEEKQIIIDAIEAGKGGEGAQLLSLLHGGKTNEVTLKDTILRYSFVVVISVIPLLVQTIIPAKQPKIFETNFEEVEKGARSAVQQENYQEAYSLTKNYLVQNSVTKKEECVLYEILQIAEKKLNKQERFPQPIRCK